MTEKTIIIDVERAGASGDMLLAALLDLLGDDQALVPVAASLLIYDPTLRVRVIPVSDAKGSGKRIDLTLDASIRLSPVSIHAVLNSVIEELALSSAGATFARDALDILLKAEAKVHGKRLEELQLHETGSIDTILDIIGCAYLLEKMGLFVGTRFLSTRVAVGQGTIETMHGVLTVPVPAVSEIIALKKIPTHKGEANTEVLTPTGAAILAALVDEYIDSLEGFVVSKQGMGAGRRDLGGIPNTMRIMIGKIAIEPEPQRTVAPEPVHHVHVESPQVPAVSSLPRQTASERKDALEQWEEDEIVVIESNVDDVDGEIMGSLFDSLLDEGLAYDVTLIPAFGKKNRPCFVVKVIAPKAGLKSVAAVMIQQLGTLGIRYTTWRRLKATRELIVCRFQIDDKEFMVRVKVGRGLDGSIISIKPEADDVQRISAETGIPVRELRPRITLQAHAVTE